MAQIPTALGDMVIERQMITGTPSKKTSSYTTDPSHTKKQKESFYIRKKTISNKKLLCNDY
jgi:hypothetical protein